MLVTEFKLEQPITGYNVIEKRIKGEQISDNGPKPSVGNRACCKGVRNE